MMQNKLIIDVLGKTGYSPRTLNLDLQGRELFDSLSSSSKVFLYLAMGIEGEGPISIGQLYGKQWIEDSSIMQLFRNLPEDARTEVLAFITLLLHEITHHLDFLTTPFGLNFHIKTMREYWSLQDFVPILLENPELIPRRFVDFESHWAGLLKSPTDQSQAPWYSLCERDSEELRKAWNSLRGQLFTFEAWGDASTVLPWPEHVERSWAGNAKPIVLLGQSLQRVTVHNFLATVAIPNRLDWYLRPLTLFETRAVAHSMIWIIHLLGEEGAKALPSYFAMLYRERNLTDDYFFLFDLIARGHKYTNFEELLQNATPDLRDHILRLLSFACWYALQAPPPMDRNSLLTSNPIARLLVVLKAYDDFLSGRNPSKFRSFIDLANSLDCSPIPQQLGCRPIQDILEFCRQAVDTMLCANKEKTRNPNMRGHFQHILKLIQAQLAMRDDYTSHIGMPERGNPIFGLESENEKLLDPYEPPEEVVNWFAFRNNLLFSLLPRAEVVERMEQHFGMNELVIPCSCGAFILGRLSRWAGRIQTTCPKCGKIHDVDTSEIRKIDLKAIGCSSLAKNEKD